MNGAISGFCDQEAVDQADHRAHRQRGDGRGGDILRLAIHEDGGHQHRELDDRADREIDAAADNDQGFANRHRAEKCGGPQHVEDVPIRQEVRRQQRSVNAEDQNEAVNDQRRGVTAQTGRSAQAAVRGRGRRHRAHAGSVSVWAPVVANSMIRSSLACSRVSSATIRRSCMTRIRSLMPNFHKVRRNHQDGDAALGKLTHELVNLELGPDVDAARRFVENDRRRRRLQPLRENDFLLVAAAQMLSLKLRRRHGDRQLTLRSRDRLGFPTALKSPRSG